MNSKVHMDIRIGASCSAQISDGGEASIGPYALTLTIPPTSSPLSREGSNITPRKMSSASNSASNVIGDKKDGDSDNELDRESFSSMSSINTNVHIVQIGFSNKNDLNTWCTLLNKQFSQLK